MDLQAHGNDKDSTNNNNNKQRDATLDAGDGVQPQLGKRPREQAVVSDPEKGAHVLIRLCRIKLKPLRSGGRSSPSKMRLSTRGFARLGTTKAKHRLRRAQSSTQHTVASCMWALAVQVGAERHPWYLKH